MKKTFFTIGFMASGVMLWGSASNERDSNPPYDS